MIATRWFSPLLSTLLCTGAAMHGQHAPTQAGQDRLERHQSADWIALAPHLPDPATGTPHALEQAADVMRARRMPEDALDYYRFALQHGGDAATLQNRIGVTLLELHRSTEARNAFRQALRLKPKDARDWNNMGAAEYLDGNFRAALDDYLHAVKLEKKVAVYHANLGTAYFEVKDYESARMQFTKAIQLDRAIFQTGGFAGIEAHVLSANDHARFCFEMARLAARQRDDESMLRWLARASEAGFDVKYEMGQGTDFVPYRKDPRIEALIRNAKAMRAGQIAEAGPVPALPPKTP